jgi:spore maturation protein CgeB
MTNSATRPQTGQNMNALKYLFVYTGYSTCAIELNQRIVERHRQRGYDVTGFCVTPNAPAPAFTFQKLDRLWKLRAPGVVKLHDDLLAAADGCDVLINFNGANIHPDWLSELSTFNVYVCWDDPESSEQLSRYVAPHFDFSFTGNLACVPLYQSWGIHRCDYLFYGFVETEYDPTLTADNILEGQRDIEISFFGERVSPWRQERLDRLKAAFPKAKMYGRGWLTGFISDAEKLSIYSQTKIGWNIHNSVGPVNLRTFALPANGILEICDNKSRLGHLFALNEEIIGFDTLDECIDLTRYYLAHDQERRAIAARGFERVMRDYSEEKRWEKILTTIEPYLVLKRTNALVDEAPPPRSLLQQFNPVVVGLARHANRLMKKTGFEVKRFKPQLQHEEQGSLIPYRENPEAGSVNWKEKEARLNARGFLEWPNIVAVNYAVASLVGPHKNIVELGGGTGVFAYEVTSDPQHTVLCSEYDEGALNYAREHRSRTNITYTSQDITSIQDRFDLVVSVDVIEHIEDYRGFLDTCLRLAPNAIITTPNKNRSGQVPIVNGPPEYTLHVREWTPGELYWVLKAFYADVYLYSLPNPYVPDVQPIDLTSDLIPLIAVCSGGK